MPSGKVIKITSGKAPNDKKKTATTKKKTTVNKNKGATKRKERKIMPEKRKRSF